MWFCKSTLGSSFFLTFKLNFSCRLDSLWACTYKGQAEDGFPLRCFLWNWIVLPHQAFMMEKERSSIPLSFCLPLAQGALWCTGSSPRKQCELHSLNCVWSWRDILELFLIIMKCKSCVLNEISQAAWPCGGSCCELEFLVRIKPDWNLSTGDALMCSCPTAREIQGCFNPVRESAERGNTTTTTNKSMITSEVTVSFAPGFSTLTCTWICEHCCWGWESQSGFALPEKADTPALLCATKLIMKYTKMFSVS